MFMYSVIFHVFIPHSILDQIIRFCTQLNEGVHFHEGTRVPVYRYKIKARKKGNRPGPRRGRVRATAHTPEGDKYT